MTAWGSTLRLDRPQHPMWIEVEQPIGCYVNPRLSDEFPAWLVPPEIARHHVKLGDLALVEHGDEGVWCRASGVAAAGPDGIGLSRGAAAALGIPFGAPGEVRVVVLPGSRSPGHLSHEEVQEHGRAAARAAGLRLGE